MKKVVLLLSGGVDSTALLWRLFNGKEINEPMELIPVYVHYGQLTADKETDAVNEVIAWCCANASPDTNVKKVNMPIYAFCSAGKCTLANQQVQYGTNHPAYVPYRNLLMLSLALSHTEEAQPDYIMMGVHNIDVANRFPDCSTDFQESMQDVLYVYHRVKSRKACQIMFPFCRREFKSKDDIKRDVPEELLAHCFSGYGETLAAKLTTPENTKTEIK